MRDTDSADIPTEVDVVVVGAGMAGLCASIAALETGARVLTIDKGSRIGGSMALSAGHVWSFADLPALKRAIPDGDELLQDLVVRNLADGWEWLTACGVILSAPESLNGVAVARVAQPPQMCEALHEHIRSLSGRVVLQSPMSRLLRDETSGRITGVELTVGHRPLRIDASAVVLATGGFQGNAQLLAQYVTPYADSLYVRSNPWSTGDGLLAALAVGAAMTPYLHCFYGHAVAAPPARLAPLDFLDATQRYGRWGVALNLDGRRFADESAGTGEECLNQQVARQPDATAVYLADATVAAKAPGVLDLPVTQVILDRAKGMGAPYIEAATLDELYAGLAEWGIPAARAEATIAAYNAAVESGAGAELDPPRRGTPFPLREPPFHAVKVRAGITFTSGGLWADPNLGVIARAASASGMPLTIAEAEEFDWDCVPGLYAAGADVGGISTSGYCGGLAAALVTGRRAGNEAAREAAQTASQNTTATTPGLT